MMTPRVAAIHDMSGFGRCSLTVAIPILSAMGLQCCPLPTAFLSTHTGGFEGFTFLDMTGEIPKISAHWKSLNLRFQAIYSGFLGSAEQIGMVETFIRDFQGEDTVVVVDPVMGDHGKVYQTYTPAMCRGTARLAECAGVITPNLTEACRLTDTPYRESGWTKKELSAMAEKLNQMGPEQIVITGIPQGEMIANFVYEKGQEAHFIKTFRVGDERCGTGDLFAAIIAADGVNGVPFQVSVKKASLFVKKSMQKSMEMRIPPKNGVCFEEILHTLKV